MQAGAQVAFSFIQFRTPTQRRRRQASRLGSLNCRHTMDTLRGSFLHDSKPTKWTLKMDQAKPPAGHSGWVRNHFHGARTTDSSDVQSTSP